MSSVQEYYNKKERIMGTQINNFNNYWYYFAPNWYIITDNVFWKDAKSINDYKEKHIQGYIFKQNNDTIQVKKEESETYKDIIKRENTELNVYLQNLPFHCGISNSEKYIHIYYGEDNQGNKFDLKDRLDTGDQVYSLKVDLDTIAEEKHFIFTKRPDINGFLYETRWDENGNPYFYFWYDRHILYMRQHKYNLNISLYTNKFFNYQNENILSESFLKICPNSITANLKYNEPYGVKFYSVNEDENDNSIENIEEMIVDYTTYTTLQTPLNEENISSSNYQLNFIINSMPNNYTLRIY